MDVGTDLRGSYQVVYLCHVIPPLLLLRPKLHDTASSLVSCSHLIISFQLSLVSLETEPAQQASLESSTLSQSSLQSSDKENDPDNHKHEDAEMEDEEVRPAKRSRRRSGGLASEDCHVLNSVYELKKELELAQEEYERLIGREDFYRNARMTAEDRITEIRNTLQDCLDLF